MKNFTLYVRLIVSGIVFFTLSVSLMAQSKNVSTETKEGLNTTTFKTPKGNVTVVLPSNVYAGDVISGTVLAEPKGKNERQKSKNKNVLNGYVIEMVDKSTSANQDKGSWKIPELIKDGIRMLFLKDHKGNVIAESPIPVSEIPATPLIQDGFNVPQYIRAGVPEKIAGVFDGDFMNSAISINDMPVDIIAESPTEVFFQSPEDISGPIDLELQEGDLIIEEEINIVDIEMSADRLSLLKGESTKVHVNIVGLEGIETEIPLTITNLSPGNVSLEGGITQEVIIYPENIPEDGNYLHTLDLKALQNGSFSVMASVIPPILPELNFNTESDPTFGVPGVKENEEGDLEFRDEDAVRKHINLDRAKKAVEKVKKQIKKAESNLASNQEKAKEYSANSHMGRAYASTIEDNKQKIKDLEEKAKTVADHIKNAEAAAKACNVDDTRKNSQYAQETAETGRNTGNGNYGLPVPGEGGNSLGLKTPRGPGKIDPFKYEKHKAIRAAIEKIEEMEKQLEDMKVKEIMDEAKIKEYEAKLKELQGELKTAQNSLNEMKKQNPYSMEGSVMVEVAEEAANDLRDKVDEFEKALEDFKKQQEENDNDKTQADLQKTINQAYAHLRTIYRFADACNTEQVEKYGGKIADLANEASEKTQQQDFSTMDELYEEADKSGKKAKNATESKVGAMQDADKKYFEGLYSSLLTNFNSIKSQAPHSVDDFLKYQGSNYQQVSSVECEVDGKTYTVNFNLRWSFGNTPQPASQKTGKGEDGKYEYESDAWNCKENPIEINIDAKVSLYWVFPYTELAGNKALLYHEFLHGQLMVEWLQDEANKDEICETLQRVCGDDEEGVSMPLCDSEEEEHEKIYPWHKEFQKKIQATEDKKVEEEKKKFKKKYEEQLEDK